MDSDFQENFAKIIENKTKQIKKDADKYESSVKLELQKIIRLQKDIDKLKKENINDNNNEEILNIENEIKLTKKNIKKLNQEKHQALGCDMNIGFNDDLYFKSELPI